MSYQETVSAAFAYDALSNGYREISDDLFVTFRYYRNVTGFGATQEIQATGGVTACLACDPVNDTVYIAIAWCSSEDLFNKSIGRNVSFGRLLAGHYEERVWDKSMPLGDHVEEHIAEYYSDREYTKFMGYDLVGKMYEN